MFAAYDALAWVRQELASAKNATLAVAFWGQGAMEALGLDTGSPQDRQLHIICNLAMGGTNPNEVQRLMQLPGVRISQCDTLHAKIYLFPHAAMVGSSNVSANGLSFEGPLAMGWHEANLVTREGATLEELADWVDKLPVRPITHADIQRAREAWKARRKAGVESTTRISITELLAQGPAAFSGLDLYLTLSQGEFSKKGKETVKAAMQQYPEINAWEDWDSLPAEGTLISFDYDSDRFIYEGCYARSPDWVSDTPATDRQFSLQWCFPTRLPAVLKSPDSERARWSDLIDLVIGKHGNPAVHGRGVCVGFDELSELWRKSQAA